LNLEKDLSPEQLVTIKLRNKGSRLENGHLPTIWQEPELMFRNNWFYRHNVIIAAGLWS